jgi:hypothetical protein
MDKIMIIKVLGFHGGKAIMSFSELRRRLVWYETTDVSEECLLL